MSESNHSRERAEVKQEIDALRNRVEAVESRTTTLPDSWLVDDSFLKRAFAVVGHQAVASVIISAPVYTILFFLFFLFR